MISTLKKYCHGYCKQKNPQKSVSVISGCAKFPLGIRKYKTKQRKKKKNNSITVTPADLKECGQAACTDKPNM